MSCHLLIKYKMCCESWIYIAIKYINMILFVFTRVFGKCIVFVWSLTYLNLKFQPPKKDSKSSAKQPQKTQKKKEGSGGGKAKKKVRPQHYKLRLLNPTWCIIYAISYCDSFWCNESDYPKDQSFIMYCVLPCYYISFCVFYCRSGPKEKYVTS